MTKEEFLNLKKGDVIYTVQNVAGYQKDVQWAVVGFRYAANFVEITNHHKLTLKRLTNDYPIRYNSDSIILHFALTPSEAIQLLLRKKDNEVGSAKYQLAEAEKDCAAAMLFSNSWDGEVR